MVVCRFFQQGRCSQGDCCRFEHPKSIPPAITSASPSTTIRAIPHFDTRVPNPLACVFSQRGTCKYGNRCKYAHVLNAAAVAPQLPPTDARSSVVCTFYLRNSCYKGALCPFSHPAQTTSPNKSVGQSESKWKDKQIHHKDTTSEPSSSKGPFHPAGKTIAGAEVTFSDGATISEVILPGDVSTVTISNIPEHATSEDVSNALRTGQTCGSIVLNALRIEPQTSTQSVTAKVRDGGQLCRSIVSDKPRFQILGSDMLLTPVQLSSSESGINRLQLSVVSCTWYEASRTAQLVYPNVVRAREAHARLQKRDTELLGRRPIFTRSPTFSTVQVANLDVSTSVDDLEQYLGVSMPTFVELGPRSHDISNDDLKKQVHDLLRERGRLVEWNTSSRPGSAKVKAYAKFANSHEAAQAAKQLNGCNISLKCKTVLLMQHIVSVKLPVSQRVLDAVGPQLHALAETSRSSSHVLIKVYDNPLKAYTQIRVTGENKASVAQVKMQVEALLAGTTARDGKQLVVHKFFLQAASHAFLDGVMREHRVLIICDRRRTVVRIYGEAKNAAAAQEALVSKIAELENQQKEVILDSHTLVVALRGGLQQLITTLGKDKVKLDITSNPKRILVNGSERDADLVRTTLLSLTSDNLIKGDEEALCAICWTPAEDPLKTECNHTYCLACFEAQVASTSDFPIRCFGDSGTCKKAFPLPELSRLLTLDAYDTMLLASLTYHIRSHAKDYQYCSTPDCDRVYRTSNEDAAIIFNCDHCLTSICTACHDSAHEGETCKLARASRNGTDEFAEWKKSNDVRDCPACKAPIQKSEGCNHMECRSCGAHICWQCMRVFGKGADVYGHMTREHKGDWGLGWTRREFE